MIKLQVELEKNKNLYYNGLFFISILLSIFGCIMIYSATVCKTNPTYIFLKKQVIAILIGLLGCIILANTNHKIFLKKLTYPFSIITIILLILVLFSPKIKGAHRWIQIPFFGSFQPSEFARITIIMLIAKFLDDFRSKITNGKKEFWILISIIFIFCFLILLQPDAGIPMIIFTTTIIILYSFSVKTKHILKIGIIIIIALSFALLTQQYRIKRVLSFSSSNKDKNPYYYQIQQSIFAISRGGFFGCGIENGLFKEHYLPEFHTDFMFSIIGEEFGFLGCIFTIIFYIFLSLFGFTIAYKSSLSPQGYYGSILSFGLTLNIIIQAFISIAVAMKFFLPKGIGLPFISYGGSSLIMNFLSIGIILNVCKTKLIK
jgi:cell division protein FtsW